MKTYLRLLSFTRPLGGFVLPYTASSVLTVLFGIMNFGLLIPLLEVLFSERPSAPPAAPPAPAVSVDYAIGTFNYYFSQLIATDGKIAALQLVCVVLVSSVLLSNIFRYTSVVLMEGLRVRFVQNLRNRIFAHTMRLPLGYFSNERKGDIMARITSDVAEVEFSVSKTIDVLLKEPLTLFAYIYSLVRISPSLTLFSVLVIPVSGGIIALITKRLRSQAREAQQIQGNLITVTEEALGATRVIKAFNAQDYIIEKFAAQSRRYAEVTLKMARRREIAPPFSEFSGVLVVAIILLYGGSLVLSGGGELKASAFITYLAIFSQILRPAKQISQSFSNISKGLASGERIFQILDVEPTLTSPPDGKAFAGLQKEIVFDNVSFAYESREVISGLTLRLERGRSLALVGPSGSGKSTLADLLMRFYDPTAGQVLVDGLPLPAYDIASLRAHIGMVSQETVLFNDTVFNNIAFCKPGATQAEVEAAARVANAHDFISAMESGYQTIVGDRGTRLSGGQRQRLSIARAVLLDPEILILDEATSALDTESERLVQQALAKLLAGRTSLIIAHRLSTIREADQIVVLERGRIREQGSHQDLLAGDQSLYKRMVAMQDG